MLNNLAVVLAVMTADRTAEILIAPAMVIAKSQSLVSPHLAEYAPNTLVRITMRVNESRRTISNVLPIQEKELGFSASWSQKLVFYLKNHSVLFWAEKNGKLAFRNHRTSVFWYAELVRTSSFSKLDDGITNFKSFSITNGSESFTIYSRQEVPNLQSLSFDTETVAGVESDEPVAEKVSSFMDGRIAHAEGKKMRQFGKSQIFVSRYNWELMTSMLSVCNNPRIPSAILLVGESGWAKTSIPEAFAEEKGMEFVRINCATIRDPEDFLGYREAKDGSTIFVKSPLVQAIERGNVVIVFDEVNRLEPWMTNVLFSLLDHSRSLDAHGETVAIGENCLIFATANIGSKFVGTFQVDAAFVNRFGATIRVGEIERQHETMVLFQQTGLDKPYCMAIVDMASKIRDFARRAGLEVDISMRTTLKIASMAQNSVLDMMAILDFTVINQIDDPAVAKQVIDLARPVLSSAGMV